MARKTLATPSMLALAFIFLPLPAPGQFVYVSNGGLGVGSVSGYMINPSSGALTAIPGSPFAGSPSRPTSLVVDPSLGASLPV